MPSKYHGVSVYTDDKFNFMIPMVYSNGAWHRAEAKIRTNNTWRSAGEACTQMLWVIDQNGNPVYLNNIPYLVREEWDDGTTNGAWLQDIYERDLIDKNELLHQFRYDDEWYKGGTMKKIIECTAPVVIPADK